MYSALTASKLNISALKACKLISSQIDTVVALKASKCFCSQSVRNKKVCPNYS